MNDARPPRAYRWLLRLLPAERRARHGDAMATLFAELLAGTRAERGLGGAARLWMREAAGLGRFAWRERSRPMRRWLARRTWSLPMPTLSANVRLALRSLRRQRAFALALLISIAAGVGVTTAVFSAINGVLLRPLPFPAPDRLVDLWEARDDGFQSHSTISGPEAVEWRRRFTSAEALAAYRYAPLTLTGRGDAVRIIGIETTPEFFAVLRRQPILGRVFADTETGPAAAVVVLSERIWQTRFGGDRAIVGRSIELDGVAREVIGVMPADAAFPAPAEAWIPARADWSTQSKGQHFLSAIARLRADRSLQEARAELDRVAADLEREWPDANRGHRASFDPLADTLVAGVRPALTVLFVSSLFVLLIVAANTSSLLLARAVARRREFVVRRALGARTWDLVTQLAAEGVILALPGGLLGALVASAILRLVLDPAAGSLPRSAGVRLDAASLLFALAVTLVIGIVASLLPLSRLMRTTAPDLASRGGTGDRHAVRLRHLIVAGQVAAAFALACGSALLARSLVALSTVDTGFAADRALTFNVQLAQARYRSPGQQTDFVTRALERLRAIPGVTAAGVVSDLPFSGSRSTSGFAVEDRPTPPDQSRSADMRVASPGYLPAMGIALRGGRDFTTQDAGTGEPVAIVNEAFADAVWPGENAIGKRIRIGHPDEVAVFGSPVWRTVVGVAGNVIHDDLRATPNGEIYLPFAQSPLGRLAFVARSSGDPSALTASARAAIADVDPRLAIYNTRTMAQRLAQSMATPRLLVMLTTIFATTALLLAAFGLHATLTHAVAQRTAEFGIRVALGARPAHIARAVARDTLAIVAAGLAAGAGAAVLFTRWMSSSLFGVTPTDVLTLTSAAMLVAALAAISTIMPTRKALSVSPAGLLQEGRGR
jgi:putative ABC transport system permease protein